MVPQNSKPAIKTKTLIENMENNTPCKTEQELLERYACIALEKQNGLAEVIGNNNWNVDMGKGEISFGPTLHFPIQVLGTISHSAQSWLWAWANTAAGLSQQIMAQSLQLKAYGEENGQELSASRDGNTIQATFDELSRLTELKG